MTTFEISINPLAEYLEATDARKRAIVKEQLKPMVVKAQRYQLAKARIKKSVALSGSFKPINDAIDELKTRKPTKKNKISDNVSSILALEKYLRMALPELVAKNRLEILSIKQKFIPFHGINIKVSPDLIFRITIDGVKHIGACKIHVSKNKAFSTKQSKLVAAFIELYVSNCVVGEDEKVNPVLCFCIDPFAGTTINSNSKIGLDMAVVKKICEEIKRFISDDLDVERVA